MTTVDLTEKEIAILRMSMLFFHSHCRKEKMLTSQAKKSYSAILEKLGTSKEMQEKLLGENETT